MSLILLAILTVAHSQTYNQSCILTPIRDKIVTPGQNVSFHCETNDQNAYWIINGEYYWSSIHFDRPHPPFTLTRRTIGDRTHLNAIIQTNSSHSRGIIECACTLPGAHLEQDIVSIANWATCLSVDHEVTSSVSYSFHTSYIINSNFLLGVMDIQLPMNCHNGTLYYNIDMEDVETHRNTTTSGQEDFQIQNVSIITGRLRENRTYVVHMKAKFVQLESWYLFNSTDYNTGGNIAPVVSLCSDSNSIQSTSVYTPIESSTPLTPHIDTLPSGLRSSSSSLMISVVVLGVFLQLLIILVIVTVCGLILRRKCGRIKRKTRTMVTNPIYDGPMYESIHPQFRMVNSQNAAANTEDSASVKEGRDEPTTSDEQERETSSENEMDGTDPPSSPRYLTHPKPHPPQSTVQQEIVEVSLTSMASLNEAAPAQTQPKDRNVLGLTLDLSGGHRASRGRDYGIPGNDSGRQTRRRAATVAQSRPLLHSYFSSASSTPGEDDNYTVMSPVTHLPVVTPDGTSFLRQECRIHRDRCTTLI